MKILFVCLGNICRSPMAEGIMKHLIRKNHLEWEVDSAGTESYHVGERPDRRAIDTCKRCSITITDQRARKITKEDFQYFDIVYALATDVMDEIHDFLGAEESCAEIKLLLDEIYPGQSQSVPDPWYGDEEGFEPVFDLVNEACLAILNKYRNRE